MKRSLFTLMSVMILVVTVFTSTGCASRRAKKSTAPDVLIPAPMAKPAPIALMVLSPEYPGILPDGKATLLRAPDAWEANLKLSNNIPSEPLIFEINYATAKTVAVGMGSVALADPNIDLKSQVVMDHANLIGSGEFDFVDMIEKYNDGYKIRVGITVKSPSSNEQIKSFAYFYVMNFLGDQKIIFRAFVLGATEEKYDYIKAFEKSLDTLTLVDASF